ncbi:MAG: hypothetical protein ACK5Z5_02130 [Neisseriaceae bacterium]
MKKDLDKLLEKTTTNKKETSIINNPLADQLSQFDKADQIMNSLNNIKNENITTSNVTQDHMIRVTYMLPESYNHIINNIIKTCMREEIMIYKSEIIRLGIKMVSELSSEELIKNLELVRVEQGRPKKLS